MSSERAATIKLWIWSGVACVASAGLLAHTWAVTDTYRITQSAKYAQMGERGSGSTSQLDFRLANILDDRNQLAAWHTASAELTNGNFKEAVRISKRTANDTPVGQLSAQFEVVWAQSLLEANKLPDAVIAAKAVVAVPSATDDQLVTAAEVFSGAGEGTVAATLETRLSTPQALQRVIRAVAGNVSLASELMADGLPHSAQRILEAAPSSAPRDLMLARLMSDQNTKSSQTAAANDYRDYLSAQPADASARLEYAALLDKLKRNSDANQQQKLAAQLAAGQP